MDVNNTIFINYPDNNGVFFRDFQGNKNYVRPLFDEAFGTHGKQYRDGNRYNNSLDNLI